MPDKEYLTPSELEIEARAKAATPGPWETCEEETWTAIRTLTGHWVADSSRAYKTTADFIAHARADIPTLLATLRAERAKREELERAIKEHIKDLCEHCSFLASYNGNEPAGCWACQNQGLREALGWPLPYLHDPHTPGPDGPQGGC